MATKKSKNPDKISDLIPDDKNFNKGSQFGSHLIEKSLQQFGTGRSILLDKNNRIIAGNKTVEGAGSIGIDDVVVVESDGTKIIAVKRTDIDLDSPEGRQLALADNATAKHNIVLDVELIEAEIGEVVAQEWGESAINYSKKNQEIDINSFDDNQVIKLTYSVDDYEKVKTKLQEIAPTAEMAVLKLLKLD